MSNPTITSLTAVAYRRLGIDPAKWLKKSPGDNSIPGSDPVRFALVATAHEATEQMLAALRRRAVLVGLTAQQAADLIGDVENDAHTWLASWAAGRRAFQ